MNINLIIQTENGYNIVLDLLFGYTRSARLIFRNNVGNFSRKHFVNYYKLKDIIIKHRQQMHVNHFIINFNLYFFNVCPLIVRFVEVFI